MSDPEVSESLDHLWPFPLQAGYVGTCLQESVPLKPSGSLSCHHVHNCIFCIDSLKYVFETGPFQESSYGPKQVHQCMENPSIRKMSFR